ncbi:MAG: UMP kinase [Candidatus Methanofastidiosia archaeon]|jgi:uridylate kinase
MRIVLRIGGSIVVPHDIDVDVLHTLIQQMSILKKQHEIYVVVGGGKTARNYITAARQYSDNENVLDELGISASRLNALLLCICVKDAQVVTNIHEALHSKPIPVLGGTTPGQTTDTVAALLAEVVKADMMIKVTNVNGIYTDDPNKVETAQKIDSMSFKELETFSQKEFEAGISSVIDPVAAKIIAQNTLKVVVIGKEDMKDLLQVVKGNHQGTVIG